MGEDLDKTEKSEQLRRYFGLHNLILTDYLEFRWFVDGKLRLSARLASSPGAKRLRREPEGERQLLVLLHEFLAYSLATLYTPQDLAQRMAKLAHIIRDLLLRALETEPTSGRLHNQFDAFRETLIPDLKPDQFSDMYAQTIAYGLFAARCQTLAGSRDFSRAAAADLIPRTNPFLRRLFREIAFELDPRVQPFVDDLVALLRHAEIGKIMEDFGKRTAREDPVVHFYEDFLQEYDPKVREMRGVYYTPEPVVSYIVRSVDHLLKTKFSKPMGLADKDVLILDPACGTGTFLYFVIRHIYDALAASGQKGQWNSYVSENLLKRVFGFELLMAPYAVAHLKLGLLLQELGYKFESDERLGVYLTNTLEEAIRRSERIFAEWISEEANSASEIKREKPIMVVLGNPPYSNFGQMNRGTWILNLLKDYKVGLAEKKLNLDDDFIKFIRFGQWRIDKTGYGILAFISNNTYLDGITHRRMRESLLHSFSEIHLLDLHGSAKRREKAPDGSKDENVFDIQQGVAIALFSKTKANGQDCSVLHADLAGLRAKKYSFLGAQDVASTRWTQLAPIPKNFFFKPHESQLEEEYRSFHSVTEIFPVYSSGFQTKRDKIAVAETKQALNRIIEDFANLDSDELRAKYQLPPDGRDWRVDWARRHAQSIRGHAERIVPCLYRPFDVRWTLMDDVSKGFVAYPRYEVMHNMLPQNIALVVTRQLSLPTFQHAFVTHHPIDGNTISLQTREYNYLFPLFVEDGKPSKQHPGTAQLDNPDWLASNVGVQKPNISPTVMGEFLLKLAQKEQLKPEDVLHYTYAILYSHGYRMRYNSLLRIQFPRIPITSERQLFSKLVVKGRELASLHLMESPRLNSSITRYEQPGDHLVSRISYLESNPKAGIKAGRVYINPAQFFEGVPNKVWEFHIGGYQVCDKWLKDRKGRKLSSDDIDHYQKIVVAISETIRIMKEIDDLIPGWPLP